jgi:3',5'-cyclic AMP phosphodiesterase CpdA
MYRSRLLVLAASLALVVGIDGTRAQTPRRIVAVGDIHGAHDQFVSVLTRAGLIDGTGRWTGGATTLVQTGDYTDRGAKVRAVLDLLMALEERAKKGGGQVTTLLGNHEVMNILGDVRDVTPEICLAFADSSSENRRETAWKQYEALAAARAKVRAPVPTVYGQSRDEWLAAHPPGCLEYREALSPRGRYGKWLRTKSIAAVVEGTLFMHAGISPDRPAAVDAVNSTARSEMSRFESYFQRMVNRKLALPFFTFAEVLAVTNAELEAASVVMAAAKVKGEAPDLSAFDVALLREAIDIINMGQWSLLAPDGPLWFRGYALWPEDEATRAKVFGFLETAKLARVVVGHTPMTSGITPRFDSRVVLIDTGMLTQIYKGRPAALELRGTTLSAIYEEGVQPLTPARQK